MTSDNSEPTKRCPYCGEQILAIAIKCRHCGSNFAEPSPPASQAKTFDIGWAILAIPFVGSLLLWFWVGNMNLLQGPGSAIDLIGIAVIVVSAALCAVEASKLGMRSDRKAGTYSPTSWVFIILLLWIVGYPAYLFKRRKYGVRNLLLPGLALTAVFLLSLYALTYTIDSRVAKINNSVNDTQGPLEPQSPPSANPTSLAVAPSPTNSPAESDASPSASSARQDSVAGSTGDELTPDKSANAKIVAYCHKLAGTANGSYVIERGCREEEVESWNELSSEVQAQKIPDQISRYCTAAPFNESYVLINGCVKQEIEAKISLGKP